MNQTIAVKDAYLAVQRAKTAAQRAKARASASRQAELERGALPVPIPEWALPRQVAHLRAVAAELRAREALSKIARGWERLPLRTAPPGSAPVGILLGARMIRLVIDPHGKLRMIEHGGGLGPAVTIPEACATARG